MESELEAEALREVPEKLSRQKNIDAKA